MRGEVLRQKYVYSYKTFLGDLLHGKQLQIHEGYNDYFERGKTAVCVGVGTKNTSSRD